MASIVGCFKYTYENKNQSRESNSYEELLRKLNDFQIEHSLITFNYDLLLDYALKDVRNITFTSSSDYINNNYYKLHGSVNWFLEKRPTDLEINLLQENRMSSKVRLDMAAQRIFMNDPIHWVEQVKDPDDINLYSLKDLFRGFGNQYFYPLLFMPITTKAYDLIKGFGDRIISKAKNTIISADEIFMVGYAANDSLIKDLISKVHKDTVLHVVGKGESPIKIMDKVLKWNEALKKGDVYNDGFKDFAYNANLKTL